MSIFQAVRGRLAIWLLGSFLPACAVGMPACTRQQQAPAKRTVNDVIATVPALAGYTYTFVQTPFGTPDFHVIRCPLSVTTIGWEVHSGQRTSVRNVSTVDEREQD